MSTPPTILTRADDFGAFASSDQAILAAAAQGLLKNISILACGPWLERDAGWLREGFPLCLGLHLALSSEWDNYRWGPVRKPADASGLVDAAGNFHKTPGELYSRRPALASIQEELKAQLERVRRLGLQVEYVDEHMAFTSLGWDPSGAYAGPLGDWIKAWAASEGLVCVASIRSRSLPAVAPETAGGLPKLHAQLRAAEPGGLYQLIGHPGQLSAELQAVTGMGLGPGELARERDLERQYFTDPAILALFSSGSCCAMAYRELPSSVHRDCLGR